MAIYKFFVYDDAGRINTKEFEHFSDAYDYAQQGLLTYIYAVENDKEFKMEEDGELIWTWDDIHEKDQLVSKINSLYPEEEKIVDPECDPEFCNSISKSDICCHETLEDDFKKFEDNLTESTLRSEEEQFDYEFIEDICFYLFHDPYYYDLRGEWINRADEIIKKFKEKHPKYEVFRKNTDDGALRLYTGKYIGESLEDSSNYNSLEVFDQNFANLCEEDDEVKSGYIVRNSDDEYLTEDGEWVEDIDDAYVFSSKNDAVHGFLVEAQGNISDLEDGTIQFLDAETGEELDMFAESLRESDEENDMSDEEFIEAFGKAKFGNRDSQLQEGLFGWNIDDIFSEYEVYGKLANGNQEQIAKGLSNFKSACKSAESHSKITGEAHVNALKLNSEVNKSIKDKNNPMRLQDLIKLYYPNANNGSIKFKVAQYNNGKQDPNIAGIVKKLTSDMETIIKEKNKTNKSNSVEAAKKEKEAKATQAATAKSYKDQSPGNLKVVTPEEYIKLKNTVLGNISESLTEADAGTFSKETNRFQELKTKLRNNKLVKVDDLNKLGKNNGSESYSVAAVDPIKFNNYRQKKIDLNKTLLKYKPTGDLNKVKNAINSIAKEALLTFIIFNPSEEMTGSNVLNALNKKEILAVYQQGGKELENRQSELINKCNEFIRQHSQGEAGLVVDDDEVKATNTNNATVQQAEASQEKAKDEKEQTVQNGQAATPSSEQAQTQTAAAEDPVNKLFSEFQNLDDQGKKAFIRKYRQSSSNKQNNATSNNATAAKQS